MDNKIRIVFSAKADAALDKIMEKFTLQETPEEYEKRGTEKKPAKIAVIDGIAKNLAAGDLSEKDLPSLLQKDLGVSGDVAKQITNEIITNIVPFLEKIPEEKLSDPAFVDEMAEKLWGEKTPQGGTVAKTEKMPDFMDVEENGKLLKEERQNTKVSQTNNLQSIMPKKPDKNSRGKTKDLDITNLPKKSGLDRYREPIG